MFSTELFKTKNGSTIAITPDGDIISVCANPLKGKRDSGKALLEFAVEHGGTKLDSFDGNFKFYQKCGFEPISRCKFNEDINIRPDDWRPKKDKPEDVVFFKYTGKNNTYKTIEEFRNSIDASMDYDEAWEIREKVMKL